MHRGREADNASADHHEIRALFRHGLRHFRRRFQCGFWEGHDFQSRREFITEKNYPLREIKPRSDETSKIRGLPEFLTSLRTTAIAP
jgi:hypothetical protein